MRSDRRNLSPPLARTAPLLAAGPWLRDVLRLNPGRTPSARSARTAQPAGRSSCRRAPTPTRSALAATVGAAGVLSISGGVDLSSEASVIIFHDGWYYLLVTDSACCAGVTSSRNIRVGRSRKATGPFVDNLGLEIFLDGGELLGWPSGRLVDHDYFD